MELLILICIAIILFFPIACGVVAYKKNRSTVGWIIVSLFLPLIAFIILLCLSPLEPKARIGIYTTTKRCPFCGEEIQKIAKKCKHCGEFLPTPTTMRKCSTPQSKLIKNKVKEWEKICQQKETL